MGSGRGTDASLFLSITSSQFITIDVQKEFADCMDTSTSCLALSNNDVVEEASFSNCISLVLHLVLEANGVDVPSGFPTSIEIVDSFEAKLFL